jgi:nicotinate (nicotinamide) nucleotide adenylyltransferase
VNFVRRAPAAPRRLGILAGSFNPPTRAHVALVEAAAPWVDEVLCVVPRVFPHKLYHGATLCDRLRMLEAIQPASVAYSIAVAERGLFIDIARECSAAYGPETELIFVCGRDAAERFVEWDYGEPGAVERMLTQFRLLVAARQGQYEPPAHLAARIGTLEMAGDWNDVSSTEVREHVRHEEPVACLVPDAIRELVERIYR